MSSRSRIELGGRMLGAAVALGAMLGGCSDIYYDRRETVALGANDHLAANQVAQMVDPWPQNVGEKNIAFNGQRMQAGVERYRFNRVIPPVNVTTSSLAQQQAQQQAAITSGATNQMTSQGAPAAAVK